MISTYGKLITMHLLIRSSRLTYPVYYTYCGEALDSFIYTYPSILPPLLATHQHSLQSRCEPRPRLENAALQFCGCNAPSRQQQQQTICLPAPSQRSAQLLLPCFSSGATSWCPSPPLRGPCRPPCCQTHLPEGQSRSLLLWRGFCCRPCSKRRAT